MHSAISPPVDGCLPKDRFLVPFSIAIGIFILQSIIELFEKIVEQPNVAQVAHANHFALKVGPAEGRGHQLRRFFPHG